jgi:uncharacterized repeat protein (TIGR01451 family)
MKEASMKKSNGIMQLGFSALMLAATAATLATTPPMRVAAAAPAVTRPGCIELKSVAQTEQEVLDEKGQKVRRLTPPASIVPGTQVVWTITASNVCEKAAGNVLIDNPVPEHMSYVADSALGAGATISYSLDGKRYAAPEALEVREAADKVRAARADEYTHIRWSFQNAIAPGQVAIARFRAVVK